MPRKNLFHLNEKLLVFCEIGPSVLREDDGNPLQGKAPYGFVHYRDGVYDGFARKSDGAGLRDLHDTGECPKDCVYCKGDTKKATSEAEHEGMKAKAKSQYWKAGRTQVKEDTQKAFDPRDRHQTSPCCGGRMQPVLERVNTQVGRQVVWACNTCGHMQVWIEPDSK